MGKQIFNIKGMMRDLDPAKSPNQYAYEIRNLRLTAQEDSTLLALTTEKGNIQYTLTGDSITGDIVGYCALGKYITIFTHHTNNDYIYRLEESLAEVPTIAVTLLYSGDLGFTSDTKIEALGVYENENIQKVYWIDGIHQPRLINIMKSNYTSRETFDFVKSVSLGETLEITKNFGEGLFNAGTIEYAICYFNKNGQASNITSISPIYYIADSNYGGSPESSILNNFSIKVINPDENFEYIRIYSIQRTSINGTPICKKVADIDISKNIKTQATNYILGSFYPDNTNPDTTIIQSETLPSIHSLVVFKRLESTSILLSEFMYDLTSDSVIYRVPKDYILCTTEGASAGGFIQVTGYSNDTSYIEITHTISTDTVILAASNTKKYTAAFLAYSNVRYIKYIDYGYSAESIDYAELLYIGGSVLKPKSIESKDGTLFFGNYTYDSVQLTSSLISTLRDNVTIKFGYSEIPVNKGDSINWYQYNNQLDLSNEVITTFKGGETYAFGLILQDRYGIWSSVIPLGSAKNTYYPFEQNEYFRPVKAGIKLTDTAYDALINAGIIRLKVVLLNDRNYQSVFYQGALCPTVFSKERSTSNIYAQSSWYIRNIPHFLYAADSNRIPQRTHNRNIASVYNTSINTIAEIYGASDSFIKDVDLGAGDNPADFFVDWNTLTLHSPDIHFEETYTKGLKNIRLIGRLPIKSVRTNMQLTLKTPGKSPAAGLEYTKHQAQNSIAANYHDLSLFTYLDYSTDASGNWVNTQKFLYPILTWHRLGSITMQPELSEDWVAELDTKVMSTIKVCPKTIFTTSQFPIDTTELHYYKDDSQPVYIEQDEYDLDFPDIRMYLGEVDSIITSSVGMKAVAKNQAGILQNSYNYYNRQGVRIRYKSTPHGVLSLKYSTSNLQTILPNVPSNNSVKLPFWSKQSADIPSYDYQIKSEKNIYFDGTNISDNPNHTSLKIKASYADTFFGESVEVRDLFLLHYTGGSFIGGFMTPDDVNKYIWYLASKNYTLDGETYYVLEHFNNEYVGGVEYWNTKPSGDYEYIFALISDVSVTRYREIIEVRWSDNIQSFSVKQYTNIGTIPRATSGINRLTGYETDYQFDYLYLAEYYKDSPVIDLFTSHNWIAASQPIRLTELNKLLLVTYGDTYYQRYDCLKTYPYSIEDQNQVVEIFSFMCETRVNIDGRYDTRRGQIDNTSVLGTNFNLLNKVYTQEDNFFNYHYLDPGEYNIDSFPNQLIWTKTKVYGSDIDDWTQIIPTSTLDMDGTLGEVQALKLWDDNLMCFQDRGISKIMYNERTTISTQQGVPIEIANSGKVDGSQYISNQIGCSNKDSIQVTQAGIYFIDDNTKEIYRWSKGLESLSKGKGFNTYLYNNAYINTEKTFYDPKLKDVYFQFGGECLIYNEQLAEFTSFLDYDMKFMLPLKDSLIAIKDNSLWKQFAGNYLSFFGIDKGYSIDIISSEQPTTDKIFSTIEFRADVLDDSIQEPYSQQVSNSLNVLPFTKIRVWNEYQDTQEVDFERQIRRGTGANLAQKFRIWRGDIPRVNGKPLERIRNPWARIKLSDAGSNKKTVIHDIAVTYF